MNLDRYTGIGEELAARIEALIFDHPEILAMTDAWPLFKIPAFKCDDLAPTLGQANAALVVARARFMGGR